MAKQEQFEKDRMSRIHDSVSAQFGAAAAAYTTSPVHSDPKRYARWLSSRNRRQPIAPSTSPLARDTQRSRSLRASLKSSPTI